MNVRAGQEQILIDSGTGSGKTLLAETLARLPQTCLLPIARR